MEAERQGFVTVRDLCREQQGDLDDKKLHIQLTVEDTTAVMAVLDRMTEWSKIDPLPKDMVEFIETIRQTFVAAVEEAVNGWGSGPVEKKGEGVRSKFEFDPADDEEAGKKVN
jgi:hypothetical protein